VSLESGTELLIFEMNRQGGLENRLYPNQGHVLCLGGEPIAKAKEQFFLASTLGGSNCERSSKGNRIESAAVKLLRT